MWSVVRGLDKFVLEASKKKKKNLKTGLCLGGAPTLVGDVNILENWSSKILSIFVIFGSLSWLVGT